MTKSLRSGNIRYDCWAAVCSFDFSFSTDFPIALLITMHTKNQLYRAHMIVYTADTVTSCKYEHQKSIVECIHYGDETILVSLGQSEPYVI